MNVKDINALAAREVTPGTRVDPMFPGRWSPRAFDPRPLGQTELMTLFEAARWAPSCFNAQPWRFAYALNGSADWGPFFDCLVEGNRKWVANAGALVAIATRRNFEHNGKPNPTHEFDAGAAWMSIALQARLLGLFAHGMAGFDAGRLREVLAVPDGYAIPAIFAVGHPGDLESLPPEYQERETPSPRKPLAEIVFAGNFSTLAE